MKNIFSDIPEEVEAQEKMKKPDTAIEATMHFERVEPDGNIKVLIYETESKRLIFTTIIEAEDWVKGVAAVSNQGIKKDTLLLAEILHAGETNRKTTMH